MKRFTKVSQLTLALCLVSLTAVNAEARCGRSKPVRKALAKMFEGRRGCSNPSKSACSNGACQPSKNVGELPTCADGACHQN